MTDVPEWLQLIRRQTFGNSRDAPRPRPPVQAQAPSPFPFTAPQPGPGSTIGGMVGAMRPPPPAPPQQQPQGQRPSLMSQYANVVPVQGLMDLGGFVGGQAMRAPGRLLRGEPTNAMPPPPPPAPGFLPTIGPPTSYEGEPPPFPFMAGDQMRGESFAEVYDPRLSREATPRSAPYGGSRFAPPDAAGLTAERAARDAGENRDWNASVFRGSAHLAAEREIRNRELERQAEEGAAAFANGGIAPRDRRQRQR